MGQIAPEYRNSVSEGLSALNCRVGQSGVPLFVVSEETPVDL
jgi:hypothetical protein